jgi:MoxR-like ATPase
MKTAGLHAGMPDAAFDRETFLKLRELVSAVPIPANVAEFAVKLCSATRPDEASASQHAKDYLAWGAGPRGSQNLVLAAKARALLHGRTVPTIEDVRILAIPILRHRIVVNHRAIGDGVDAVAVVERLLEESQKW